MPVATCVITLSLYSNNGGGYPPSPVEVNVPSRLAAMARASMKFKLIEPKDIPAPYTGIGIEILGPDALRFRSIDKSNSLAPPPAPESLKCRRSKPPPEFPTLYCSEEGGLPVVACSYVAKISSGVHRLLPKAPAIPYCRVGRVSRPRWMRPECFSIDSVSPFNVSESLLLKIVVEHRPTHVSP